MSRYEKHRARREQMQTDYAIQQALERTSPRVEALRQELDAINPKIARPARPVSIRLLNLMTVEPKASAYTTLIESLMDGQAFHELSAIRTQAELFIYSASPDGGYEGGWMQIDQGYEQLRACAKQLRDVEKASTDFEQQSFDSYKRFSRVVNRARKHEQNADAGMREVQPAPIVIGAGRSAYLPYLLVTGGFFACLLIALIIAVVLFAQ